MTENRRRPPTSFFFCYVSFVPRFRLALFTRFGGHSVLLLTSFFPFRTGRNNLIRITTVTAARKATLSARRCSAFEIERRKRNSLVGYCRRCYWLLLAAWLLGCLVARWWLFSRGEETAWKKRLLRFLPRNRRCKPRFSEFLLMEYVENRGLLNKALISYTGLLVCL